MIWQLRPYVRLARNSGLQCLGGFIANEPEEAVYYNTTKDGGGLTLDGLKNYTLHFSAGQLPEVNGFWSLTLYNLTYNFNANPIDRYAIGDRSAGLTMDPDGGLTIYIQNTSPGTEKGLTCPARTLSSSCGLHLV